MTQTARPASDITTTNWTTTPLWSKVNDNSDSTTIRNNNGVTTACEVKLGSLTDPETSANHVVSIRGFATGSSAAEQVEFSLVQGTTVIATRAGASIQRTTPITQSMTLTGTQADAITDYTDLRIRVRMSTGAGTEFLTIADVWLDVPDAPVLVAGSDAGSGSDILTPEASIGAGDSGSSAEASALAVPPMSASESGIAADISALTAMIGTTDGGSGGDGGGGSAPVAGADTGSASDTASLNMGGQDKAGSDTASGTETASLTAVQSASESALSLETSAVGSSFVAGDAATGADASVLGAVIGANDTALATDGGLLRIPIAAQDSATGSDTAVKTEKVGAGPILYLRARYSPELVFSARYDPALVLVGERA